MAKRRRIWRILKTILLVSLVAAGLVWLARHDGAMSVEWMGYRIEMRMLFAVPMALLVLYLLLLSDRLMQTVLGFPGRMKSGKALERQERAYECVMQGFTAIAAGDVATARRLSDQAQKLFSAKGGNETPLSLLLAAQTEQLSGNDNAAQDYYARMLSHESSEFLGLRGLLVAAMRRIPAEAGQAPESLREALDLAERAYALQPKARWVVLALTELYLKDARWHEAERLVRRARKRKALSAEDAARLKTLLYYHQAERLVRRGEVQAAKLRARKIRMKQARAMEGLAVPVLLLKADVYAALNQRRRAIRLLERAWRTLAHPDIGARYLELQTQAGLTGEKLLARVEKITQSTADELESLLLRAQAAMQAQQWGKTRNLLTAAIDKREETRACRLMAELEVHSASLEEAGRQAAENWRRRAEMAEADERWLCLQCAREPGRWMTLCPGCGGFDTLRWTTPGQHEVIAGAGRILPGEVVSGGGTPHVPASRPGMGREVRL